MLGRDGEITDTGEKYLYLKVLIREKVLEFRVQGRRTNIAQRHTSFFLMYVFKLWVRYVYCLLKNIIKFITLIYSDDEAHFNLYNDKK